MMIISTTVGKNPLEEMQSPFIVNKRMQNAELGYNLKNNRMISVCFQDTPFNITVIQFYAPTTSVKEGEVEHFYEDPQDILELTPKKKKKVVPFIVGDWNTKGGVQEILGVTGKFALR